MSARSRLALIAFSLVLTACATAPRFEVPPNVVAEQAARPPLTCVDVLVVTRPGFEAKKIFGLIAPANSALKTYEMSSTVARMMGYLVGELRYEMAEQGSAGTVSSTSNGYRPSSCRSHVVSVIPTEVSQSGGMPPVAQLQFTLYEVGSRRQVWQTSASFGEGQSSTPLAKALVTALQTLGMKTTPRPAIRIEIPGVPVNQGDTLATVRSTLGATAEAQPERSIYPKKRRSSVTLPDRGVQIFFDNDDKLETVKLFAPYVETIQGVRIGDSRAVLFAKLGEPTSEESITYPFITYRAGSNRVSYRLSGKGQVDEIWVTR